MPILDRAAEIQDEITGWRHRLHRTPELGFDVFVTAAFVAEKLREFGCDEVVTGFGRTGVVGVIRGRLGDGGAVALRADLDALPIHENSGKFHASTIPGRMHACGHDGHTAMLLGAAKCLAERRRFVGSVAVVFQPAEEDGGGGYEMVKAGLMERFGIGKVFGMHNLPGLPVGRFATRPGAIMAATDEFAIEVSGKGGHAAMPHLAIDPIVIASQIVHALQTVASRSVDPVESVVLSVTKFHGGDACNVIPENVELAGTVRTLRNQVALQARNRIEAICAGIAAANGAVVKISYEIGYPVTVNHPGEAVCAGDAAAEVSGEANVDRCIAPLMSGEDFSYMLDARPGALIFIGNGDTASLHHPAYDFNDEAIPHGVSYWVRLTEAVLSANTPDDGFKARDRDRVAVLLPP
jgi:amidohydrolase